MLTVSHPAQHSWLKSVALDHLEAVVAVHSCSDESSQTVPSSQGQVELTALLKGRFERLGASVEVDEFANIIARYPGRGRGVDAAPIALMIHLDTAHGTVALPQLNQSPAWDGASIPFERNPSLEVGVAHYPSLEQFVGQTVIHGFGDAPFGLDDKLGLTHLLSLATLLSGSGGADSETPNALEGLDLPPVWLIGRPDEEIGRDEALIGLAERLQQAGVTRGYTVDGIEPFEVNVANFFAGKAEVVVPRAQRESLPAGVPLKVTLGGVNTHGATAHAEGHRGAIRWAAELWALTRDAGVRVCDYQGSEERECDGTLYLWAPHLEGGMRVRQAITEVINPHIPRGASVQLEEWTVDDEVSADVTLEQMITWLGQTLFEAPPAFPQLAEDSSGWEGYSHPARLSRSEGDDAWVFGWRLRDFELSQRELRAQHLERRSLEAPELNATFAWSRQYDNMARRLEDAPELVTWAVEGAQALGIEAQVMPIRGGTGVDPFLDRGVMVANLGTGYFSPESEKELTSLEYMVKHALWLVSLLARSVA